MKLFIREEKFPLIPGQGALSRAPAPQGNFLDGTFSPPRGRNVSVTRCNLVTTDLSHSLITQFSVMPASSPALKRICAQDASMSFLIIFNHTRSRGNGSLSTPHELQRIAGHTEEIFRAAGWTYSKFKQENLGYLRQSEDMATISPYSLLQIGNRDRKSLITIACTQSTVLFNKSH